MTITYRLTGPKILRATAGAALLASGFSAAAEDERARGPIEELVVSEFRTVSPQELDTSITLLDAETIGMAAIGHFEELVPLVPNMNFSGEGSRARYFQLRGIGEREQYEGAPNPSVGFIVDDIDLSGIGGVSAAGHLDQVDVLRGPQSARYGSSALAGIVYLQTLVPGDELTASAEVTGGNADLLNLGGSLAGPLSDRLRGAVSAQYNEDNGFRENTFYYWVIVWGIWPAFGVLEGVYTFVRLLD